MQKHYWADRICYQAVQEVLQRSIFFCIHSITPPLSRPLAHYPEASLINRNFRNKHTVMNLQPNATLDPKANCFTISLFIFFTPLSILKNTFHRRNELTGWLGKFSPEPAALPHLCNSQDKSVEVWVHCSYSSSCKYGLLFQGPESFFEAVIYTFGNTENVPQNQLELLLNWSTEPECSISPVYQSIYLL